MQARLEAHGVKLVAVGAAGVCWRRVRAVLEDDFELLLMNAPRQDGAAVSGHPEMTGGAVLDGTTTVLTVVPDFSRCRACPDEDETNA